MVAPVAATSEMLSQSQLRGFRERARRLTVLERNVLLLLSRNMSHEEVAERLHVTPEAVFEAAFRGRSRLENTL